MVAIATRDASVPSSAWAANNLVTIPIVHTVQALDNAQEPDYSMVLHEFNERGLGHFFHELHDVAHMLPKPLRTVGKVLGGLGLGVGALAAAPLLAGGLAAGGAALAGGLAAEGGIAAAEGAALAGGLAAEGGLAAAEGAAFAGGLAAEGGLAAAEGAGLAAEGGLAAAEGAGLAAEGGLAAAEGAGLAAEGGFAAAEGAGAAESAASLASLEETASTSGTVIHMPQDAWSTTTGSSSFGKRAITQKYMAIVCPGPPENNATCHSVGDWDFPMLEDGSGPALLPKDHKDILDKMLAIFANPEKLNPANVIENFLAPGSGQEESKVGKLIRNPFAWWVDLDEAVAGLTDAASEIQEAMIDPTEAESIISRVFTENQHPVKNRSEEMCDCDDDDVVRELLEFGFGKHKELLELFVRETPASKPAEK